jgi:hypothetical protein
VGSRRGDAFGLPLNGARLLKKWAVLMSLAARDERFNIEYDMTEDMAERLGRLVLDRYFYGHAFHRFAPLVLVVLLAGLILLYAFEFLTREIFGFFLVVMATLVGYAWFRRVLLFQNARWASLLPFQGKESLRMEISLSPTLVSMKAGDMDYDAEWDELATVWVVPDFWVLRLKTGGQLIIPSHLVTKPMEELILQKANQVGAGVVDG